MESKTLLEIDSLCKHFSVRSGFFNFNNKVVRAVDGVSLQVFAGETLALVGESGCGKSTLARLILHLLEPSGGSIHFDGKDLASLSRTEKQEFRRSVQIIFQDPVAALNPRKTVYHILKDPLLLHGLATRSNLNERLSDLLKGVGLTPPSAYLDRNPAEFSGGQRQRIVIARAISVEPRLIVADEPVSALDISIRAQILELLKKLQRERQLTFLFITHDLSVVRSIAHRVAVMYLGEIVEVGTVERIFQEPQHPYTRALLNSTPIPDPVAAKRKDRTPLRGEVPSAVNPPSGCYFHPRCPHAFERCEHERPVMLKVGNRHHAACHLHGSLGNTVVPAANVI